MATVTWVGKATPVREYKTVLIASATVGQVRSMTIDNQTLSYTVVTGDTTTTVAAALLALWQSTSLRQWLDVAVAVDGTTPAQLNLTGPTDGAPFTVSVSSGCTLTSVTTGTGPRHLDAVANYSTGALPSAADNLDFETGTVDDGPRYAPTALSAIALARVRRLPGFAGRWGLPPVNQTNNYNEYRTRYIQFNCVSIIIEQNNNDGSNQLCFQALSGSATTINIRGSGASAPDAVDFYGTPASSVLNINGGSAIVAGIIGQTATLATIKGSNCRFFGGSGVTHTTLDFDNGSTAFINASFATCHQDNGSTVVFGMAAAGTSADPTPSLTIDGGEAQWQSTGTPGAVLVVGSSGTFTVTAAAPFAVTKIQVYAGFTVNDPTNLMTRPYEVDFIRCLPTEGRLNLGSDLKATIANYP